MDKQLTIDDILGAEDYATERVDVPEWGGYVMIKTMSAMARDAYEMSLFTSAADGALERNLENGRAKLAAACVLSPSGELMFKNEQHVKALGNKSAAAVNRIFEAAQRLNAVSDEDIEELVGNSETDQP